ncbi:hypothetical protein ACH95_02985 [Bacillus glycinifermentans]|nr:hypothetical protein ACH95_02985 [Bacillus glycinifermentans]
MIGTPEFNGETAQKIARLGSLTEKNESLNRFFQTESAENEIFMSGIRFYFADRTCRIQL